MICSDIWHKYHEWYFKIIMLYEISWAIRREKFETFWNIMSGIYAKYHMKLMLLIVYTTTHKKFVIFTYGYFKLSWNTTALSQSNCRNFSCSSINLEIIIGRLDYNLSLESEWKSLMVPQCTSSLFFVIMAFGSYMLCGKS